MKQKKIQIQQEEQERQDLIKKFKNLKNDLIGTSNFDEFDQKLKSINDQIKLHE